MAGSFLDKVLLKLSENPKDTWTVDDAVKGTSIMGGTGSGKTSASGKKLALSFLKEGWGGLVLCAKKEEAELWKEYCKAAGREKDLIIFGKNSKLDNGEDMVFNPIDYEMKRSGDGAGETHNITNIFMNIYRIGNRISGGGDVKEERYWDSALKRCLNRVIELLKLAEEDLSYANMVKIISTCDNVEKETLTDIMIKIEDDKIYPEFKDNEYCLKCLVDGYLNNLMEDEVDPEKLNAFNLVEEYFTHAMPQMGDKTKSVVTESFMGLAEPFLSGLLHKHFSGTTNIFPEWAFEEHKIIVLDIPIKEYLDAGIIAQCVFKLMFQQAMERRSVKEHPIPVFLWCDEAQYFINPYDQIFLTTARSSRVATVFLSQNVSNYLAVMGAGSEGKAKVDSLMGNLCTKVFHANSDAVTNEYASRLIGNTMGYLTTSNQQHTSFSLKDSYSQGMNSQILPQVQATEFTTLKSGGNMNDFIVHGILMVSGRKWSSEKNFIKVSFEQEFSN